MNISSLDKNFKIETTIEKEDIKFYDVKESPFVYYGLIRENDAYCRMPMSVAETVSKGVAGLSRSTAGGRVRFRTSSPYIAIHSVMGSMATMPHCARTGMAGFDLYIGDRYFKSFIPPREATVGYESLIEIGEGEVRDITINFPTYSTVRELYIGLQDGSKIEPPTPYAIEKPVVFYGSSITQGGCSSRPGTAYQCFVSRRFDCDFINLGFSGNAKGEDTMAEYIRDLPMSLFVYDYDHNAPTTEHLRNTHERMFRIIREGNPELPIIMLSRPKHYLNEEEKERLEIIKQTYKNALERGDKNVYLIDGAGLTELCGNEGTVDGCHQTDFGFASMGKAVGDLIEKYGIL